MDMKRYIIYVLIVQSLVLTGMDQVAKIEIFKSIKRRESLEMNIDGLQQGEEMSLEKSGSSPIPIRRPIDYTFQKNILSSVIEKKVSDSFDSEHSFSPPQRESSLEKILREQDMKRLQHV
jgi:hypothetical protein